MSKNKKIKLYLSKSKQGSMETLMKVRDLLSKYDVDILEFEGGDYNTDKIVEADVVVVLPHTLPKAFNYDFYLGKGQYTEYIFAIDTLKKPTFFVICVGDELYVSTLFDEDLVENDWKKEYVWVDCANNMYPLHQSYSKIKFRTEIKTDIIKITGNIPMLACSKKQFI